MIKVSKILVAANPLESPAFKAWFSGSKVVDKNGNPLRVYHGSKSVFDQFKGCSYFTDDPDEASGYALAGENLLRARSMERKYQFVPPTGINFSQTYTPDDDAGYLTDYDGPDNKIFVCEDALVYRVKSRFFILTDVHIEWDANYTTGVLKRGTSNLEQYYRNWIAEVENEAAPENPSVYPVYLSIKNPCPMGALEGNIFAERWGNEDRQSIVAQANKKLEELKAQGYDGIICPSDAALAAHWVGEGPDHDVTNYVVFSPNQVKSAISNNGEYSSDQRMVAHIDKSKPL